MASAEQIAETYDYMDRLFRLTFGDHADLSCAFFNGDFSKKLEQAQRAKHDYVFANLKVGKGSRILDIGCGWGPILKAISLVLHHGTGRGHQLRRLRARPDPGSA